MNAAETYDACRPKLFGIAYRMLGSVQDAEDVVQETYVRWEQVDHATVKSPEAYLTSIATRLALDQLKSARKKREVYVGPWLPEPIVNEKTDAATQLELAESLSTAFLVLLETLSPVERAAYVLREVFDYAYSDLAPILGKSEAACRQLVKRARARIAEGRPRFDAPPDEERKLAEKFLRVVTDGDVNDFVTILADDAILYTDGGGKVPSALRPIYGADKIARFFVGVRRFQEGEYTTAVCRVNGRTGVIVYEDGQPNSVWTFAVRDGRIERLYAVRNPDKLHSVPLPAHN